VNEEATDNFRPLDRKQVAELLDVSVSTVRLWEREFSEWVKSQPGTYGRAGKRLYGADDWRLFQIIRKQTTAGKTFDEIRATLDEDFADENFPLEELVVEPDETPQPEEGSRELVPFSRFVDLLARYEATEGTLSAISEERDYLRENTAELEAAVVDAERRAAAKEAELEVLRRLLDATPPQQRQTWLQRLFGSSSSGDG
jgi:DNA-binding transcriptional MerR regulator